MYQKMNKLPTSQRGMTLISWIVVIAFLLFQGIMAMNILPVYLTDASVKSVLKGLESDPTLSDANSAKIREVIMKRLKINNVYDFKKDYITIRKARQGYRVTVEYEPRGKLIGSLDFIVTFKHEATVASNS